MDVDEALDEAPLTTGGVEDVSAEVKRDDDVGKANLKAKTAKTKDRDATSQREVGRSAFPITRVQKILKADKELPIIAREAVFAISVATEEFIKQLCSASQKQAEREKRSTVQRKDILTVSKRAEEFWFLEDVLPLETEEKPPQPRKKDKEIDAQKASSSITGPLDRFAGRIENASVDS